MMSGPAFSTAQFVEYETFLAKLGLYSVALWCLPKEVRSEKQWEEANKAFERAYYFARTPHGFDSDSARYWFHRGCAFLIELGIDLLELPKLAVSPPRYADARDAFGLRPLDDESE